MSDLAQATARGPTDAPVPRRPRGWTASCRSGSSRRWAPGHVTADTSMLLTSILLNWVLGPALMFALAWLLLPDLPGYRTGQAKVRGLVRR